MSRDLQEGPTAAEVEKAVFGYCWKCDRPLTRIESRDRSHRCAPFKVESNQCEGRSVCQNCGKEWLDEDLNEAPHLWERVAPGEPFPSGECPDCGALCQPMEPDPEPLTVAVFVRGGMVQDIAAPEGVRVIVLDFDTDAADEEDKENLGRFIHPDDPRDEDDDTDLCAVWVEKGAPKSAPFINAAIEAAGL